MQICSRNLVEPEGEVPASMGGGVGGGGGAAEGLLCANVAGLSAGQRKLCQLYLDHMPWVGRGARSGVAECQWQFRDRRWNCSAIQDASVMGPVLDIGESPLQFLISKKSEIFTKIEFFGIGMKF